MLLQAPTLPISLRHLVRQLILDLLNHLFRLRGMELRALTPALANSGMDAGLRRAGQWAPEVCTVVDVGAAAGKWTRKALPHFPSARFLLVEPLTERLSELQALGAEHPRVQFAAAAAGRATGAVSFHVAPDLDGSGIREAASAATRTVPVTTLDGEIAQRGLPGPYFIKLDTHGFEIPILEGAANALRSTSLLMIEAYNFQVARESLRFHELCVWLGERGFRVVDLLDPLRRPADGLLWQIDLVFARHDHPAFAHTAY